MHAPLLHWQFLREEWQTITHHIISCGDMHKFALRHHRKWSKSEESP